ncbi:hypothetical protein NM688_g7194 [Phlebia brevispora]|uniref:Uncharacterized protein n=1 Tax=Phlebia brevispora TaxID=194682 RepID=A0ACC1S874_9APHY|nr:hypothetical protein NM688_g7194 [Phlebia brevispora]
MFSRSTKFALTRTTLTSVRLVSDTRPTLDKVAERAPTRVETRAKVISAPESPPSASRKPMSVAERDAALLRAWKEREGSLASAEFEDGKVEEGYRRNVAFCFGERAHRYPPIRTFAGFKPNMWLLIDEQRKSIELRRDDGTLCSFAQPVVIRVEDVQLATRHDFISDHGHGSPDGDTQQLGLLSLEPPPSTPFTQRRVPPPPLGGMAAGRSVDVFSRLRMTPQDFTAYKIRQAHMSYSGSHTNLASLCITGYDLEAKAAIKACSGTDSLRLHWRINDCALDVMSRAENLLRIPMRHWLQEVYCWILGTQTHLRGIHHFKGATTLTWFSYLRRR